MTVRPDRAEIVGGYPFPLDHFQLEALDALDAGHHVVVAAPTGSGKTVVAEYGIETTRRDGRRSFYTAPLKALSNQKFRDLRERYGVGGVGLLTGDNAIDGEAPVVVMTTEVLRNMIYAGSSALDDLGLVVLDEVHFLQDTYRGPVWEEVIVHLPPHVRLICLSATVSNTAELAAWIQTVRGPTTPVVELRRPIQPRRLLPRRRSHERPGPPAGDVRRRPAQPRRRPPRRVGRAHSRADRRDRNDRPVRGSGKRVLYTPGRVETVELLAARRLLPAIVFIFSRNQCDEAARSCLAAGLRLTTEAERQRIRTIVDARLDGLADEDLEVLGYAQFVAQLEAGIAAHHAGMVPAFKEAVEACFIEGLIKVVFATETLAVGINMPARTVVIEKLTKFTGDHHEMLTAGEYTQLTGRAGRRGIDDQGHAIVLWSPFVPFDQVATLAGEPDVPPPLGVPPDVQHGRQPRRDVHQRAGPPPAQPVVRPVPVRSRRRAHRGPPGAGAGQPGRRPRAGGQPVRRHLGVPPLARGRRATGGAVATTSWPSAWPASARARSSTPPRVATAGRWPWWPAPTARAACA